MDDLRVVYVDKLEAANSIQLVSAVGQTMPLHSTSLGKAMLAALPDGEREGIYTRMDLAPRTDWTIRELATFREEIERTRLRGYSIDDRENEPFGACVGAAIVGADDRPVGAISVSGPYFRIRDHLPQFGERVRVVAGAIARELGADAGEPTDGRGLATGEATR
jgi:DNA-binding IclR family transcriptional regulator